MKESSAAKQQMLRSKCEAIVKQVFFLKVFIEYPDFVLVCIFRVRLIKKCADFLLQFREYTKSLETEGLVL